VKSFHTIRSDHVHRPIRTTFAGLAVSALMAAGVVLVGSTPASAHKSEHVVVSAATTTVRPPALRRPQITCGAEGAEVVVKLRNRSRTSLFFEVRLSVSDYQEALPIGLSPRGVDSVVFSGVPNGRSLIEVLNDQGVYVAHLRFKVKCSGEPAPAQHVPHRQTGS
jgi:hypothetical protein